jgi:polyferredoxin
MSQKIPTQDNSANPVKIQPAKIIGMHADKPKIFPRAIRGFFQNIRHITMALALFVYAALPWLNWDGRQAILFDLSHQQFFILGLTFAPTRLFLFVVVINYCRLWFVCGNGVCRARFLWLCLSPNHMDSLLFMDRKNYRG